MPVSLYIYAKPQNHVEINKILKSGGISLSNENEKGKKTDSFNSLIKPVYMNENAVNYLSCFDIFWFFFHLI